jgi:hypothetical protein
MLIREKWTEAGVFWPSVCSRHRISLGRHTSLPGRYIYIILARVYESQKTIRTEKYISIGSDNKSDLTALQAVKTFLSVWQ